MKLLAAALILLAVVAWRRRLPSSEPDPRPWWEPDHQTGGSTDSRGKVRVWQHHGLPITPELDEPW